VVDGEIGETGKRTTFHPADIVRGAGDSLAVRPRPWDGSADHIAYARASVLIRRDAQAQAVRAGDRVRVIFPGSLLQW
jgi:molybdopterin biosynthesis enzyme